MGIDCIEEWIDKMVLVVIFYFDDEIFILGGIFVFMVDCGNDIYVVIYMSDNVGLCDLLMMYECFVVICKVEEKEVCRIFGIFIENFIWFGYDDGMFEYVDLCEFICEVVKYICCVKFDVFFLIDFGVFYV